MPNSTTAADRILAVVNSLKDHLYSFCQTLVQTPSLPGQEARVQAIVAAKLEAIGLEVATVSSTRGELESHPAFCDDGIPVEQRVNIVGRWRGKQDRRAGPRRVSLILNGHVDVVSPGNEALWEHSPWSGCIRDGKLFGRGSCDMKAGLASAIVAVEALRHIGVEPQGDVLVESVSGEESGGVGTLSTIVKGYRADSAVILEPTNLHLCVVQSGALTFRLRITGRSAHACIKHLGVSAIDKACRVLDAVARLEQERHVAFHHPLYADPMCVAPISIGTISGGDWHSTVPAQVVLEGRFGVLPGERVEEARAALRATLDKLGTLDPWLREHPPVLEWFEGQFESGATDPNAPIVRVLGDSHRAITGREPALNGVTYGSDLRLFTNHADTPTVLYGPGSVLQAHTVNEFIALEDVLTAAQVLALTIYQWCGGDTSPDDGGASRISEAVLDR